MHNTSAFVSVKNIIFLNRLQEVLGIICRIKMD